MNFMKAVVYELYGTPNVVQVNEVARPIPKDNEVLIKVRVSSINSWDWDLLRGVPFLVRLDGGFVKPRHTILGADVAGIIEEVGKSVK